MILLAHYLLVLFLDLDGILLDLFNELLQRHTIRNKGNHTTFDADGLARSFNQCVIKRPPGTHLTLKTVGWIKEWAVYLLKRVKVQTGQEAHLAQVSVMKSMATAHLVGN